MRNVLIILLFAISTAVSATTYFIDPSGKDTNVGSSSSPWKTLSYACSKVVVPGDIIHVNAGTFTETVQSTLAVGVSIEGVGVTSIIHSDVAGGPTIALFSGSTGISGNQSISNIRMDGDNLTAHSAIEVSWRSNVEIHHCTFSNFRIRGVVFGGYQNSWPVSIPSSSEYSSGNSFHDNIMNNCSQYVAADDNGWGNLCVGLQLDMRVYNNTITQNQRAAAANGYCIKFYNYGWNRGFKIYNNTLINKPPEGSQPNMSWGFAIESWNSLGGFEITGNTIKGCIDLVKVYKGTYSKGVDIHDNILGYDSPTNDMDTEGEVGIRLEDMVEYAYINNNYFRHHAAAIYCSRFGDYTPSKYFDNIYVYSNIMYNIGSNYSDKGWGLKFTVENYLTSFTNFNIWNNTIIARPTGSTAYGVMVPPGVTSNINIRNNIIKGFSIAPIQKNNSGTYNSVNIVNNIFYGNGNNNDAAGAATYNNYTIQNITKSDPLFVSASDFHLLPGSPAIGKGVVISGLITDYAGNTLKSPPSIGAYENNSVVAPPAQPIYQNSVVENITPSLVEITFSLSLANILPALSAFTVQVNSVATTINSVAISGSKVQLTLSKTIKYGDIITVTYIKPASNPLQIASGGQVTSLTAQLIANKIAAPVTNPTTASIKMTVNPNPVHQIMNILFEYTSFSIKDAAMSPQIVRIFNTVGKLYIEKVIVTGIANIRFPINLRPGIYTVVVLSGGLQMASQKMRVY